MEPARRAIFAAKVFRKVSNDQLLSPETFYIYFAGRTCVIDFY